MPESPEAAPDDQASAAVRAAEDQAIAAARHVAECAVRFYSVLSAGNLPAGLVNDLTRDWLHWFVTDDPDELDDDE